MIRAEDFVDDVEPVRVASPRRHGELIRAAEREVRFAQPMPVFAWLDSLAGAALVGGSVGFITASLIGVLA